MGVGEAWGWFRPTGGWSQVPARLAAHPGGTGTGASLLLGRQAPSASRLKGGLQNGTCQHQCPHGRMNSPKWLSPMSSGRVPVAPPLQETLRDQQVGLNRLLQITVSVLGLRACEILCIRFNSGVSASYSPLALPYASPAGFQSHKF